MIFTGVTEHTRRHFLRVGAGVAGGLVAAGDGLLPTVTGAAAASSPPDVFTAELRIFAGNFVPVGWLPCIGEEITAAHSPGLARAVGKTFGGAGATHDRLPDLRGRALVGTGHSPGGTPRHVGEYGHALVVSEPNHDPSSLGLTYLIAEREEFYGPLIGEVRAFGFGFAPKGWALCDGRTLSVVEHAAVFSIIGSRFGGDGHPTFHLPDLRSATPLSHGAGPGRPPTPIGHRHADLASAGASHAARLHVTYCIALTGNYPIRNS
jgi:microcystin-dependent protein